MKEFGRGISEAFGDVRVERQRLECVVYKKIMDPVCTIIKLDLFYGSHGILI